LLLVGHPLAVDGPSWHILLEELAVVCDRLHRGEPAGLPPATSFLSKAEPLPDLRNGVAGDAEEPARALRVELDAEATRALRDEVPKRYGNTAEDVLLAALAEALAGWTGVRRLVVDRHGRPRSEEAPGGSRTIGCLAAALPVLLEWNGPPGNLLKLVKERLHHLPAPEAGAPPVPEVGFRWSGWPAAPPSGGVPSWSAEPLAARRIPGARRRHRLDVEALLAGGRIAVVWTYSERTHRPDTVQALADRFLEALHSLIEHCRSTEARGFTPADFPEARLSQEMLDDLLNELLNREK
jgi:non-ribosomal peptide synthase protein (TIGR01720 family)